jgi:hypothetical protein
MMDWSDSRELSRLVNKLRFVEAACSNFVAAARTACEALRVARDDGWRMDERARSSVSRLRLPLPLHIETLRDGAPLFVTGESA